MATQSTRERIIHILRVQGPQAAADMAQALGITPTAVRQHLERLVAEGLVEVSDLRRGHGRPRQVFALTPQADRFFPQSYDALALDLLEAIGRLPDGADLLKRILQERRKLWTARYGLRLAGRPLSQQLQELTNLFNEKGGLAEYAAQPDHTILLTKRHCNIAAVTSLHPAFCQEERAWLEEALGLPVEALQSRATGDAACVFRIRPRAESQVPQKGG